jgi:DNA-binding NarL/FixJ family response regulator
MAAFLLISERTETFFISRLREVIKPFSSLEVLDQNVNLTNSYDLIIIDATVVQDVGSLIIRLRKENLQTPIVVAAAAPTWTRAREVYQSGAQGYLEKSLSDEEMRKALQSFCLKIV